MVVILTAFTLVAFAANSLLCRMALGGELIDPASFTTLRLTSGALALIAFTRLTSTKVESQTKNGSWQSGFALFVYAMAFSLSYLSLSTGMGALILFGAVQLTMMGSALRAGEKPSTFQWLGLLAAIVGLIYLVFPGITAPDPLGTVLMGVSGIAWGIYSIRGKGVSSPIAMTSGNFIRAAPLAIVISIATLKGRHAEVNGVFLALLSGVITSGLGYVIWYKALSGLTTTQASIVQLLVPPLAAFGGVIFLSEQVTLRLVASSALILGGVALAVANRRPRMQSTVAR